MKTIYDLSVIMKNIPKDVLINLYQQYRGDIIYITMYEYHRN